MHVWSLKALCMAESAGGKFDSDMDSKMDSNVDSNMDSDLDLDLDSDMDSHLDSHLDGGVGFSRREKGEKVMGVT